MYSDYPRVTTILQNLNTQRLLEWSNFMGLVCRKDYNDIMEESQRIGTHTHNKIEHELQRSFLSRGSKDSFENIELQSTNEIKKSNNAHYGFTLFNKRLTDMGATVVNYSTELSMVSHKYKFRGTCDWLCSINDELFLIDFKTSSDIYPKMFLQLSAYLQMLNEIGIYPKRCGVLCLNKKKKYSFKFLNVESKYVTDNLFPIFKSLLDIENKWSPIKEGWDDICQTNFDILT